MEKNKKTSKGITLIALVVTIIVLLLLAGISIQMLTGDNGIINRAGQARDLTGEKQILERVQLAYLAALTEGKGEATEPNLISELNKEFGAGNYTLKKVSGTPIGVTISEKDYYFDGTVTSGSGDEDTPKFELTIAGDGESTTMPPNPDSTVFEHVEGTTIANGYVIRDKYNGNEFVWVPVEKNQKITLDVEKEEDITGIKLIDPTGKEIDLELPATIGKKYKKIIPQPKYNGVYKAEVTTANGTTEKTLLVRSLYAQDTFNDYFTDEWTADAMYNLYKSLGFSDERIYQLASVPAGKEITNRIEFDMVFRDIMRGIGFVDLEDYKNSVNTYGGFYIGRYESGDDDGTLVSRAGVEPYINLTRSQAKDLAENMYTGKSHLLTGAAWDRTLGWIINENDRNLNVEDIVANSSSWGNYSDSTFEAEGKGSKANTGAFGEHTKVNNIYDLAGNVFEWTSEQGPNSSFPGVARGGYCSYTGYNYPSSFRSIEQENMRGIHGFRVALFL